MIREKLAEQDWFATKGLLKPNRIKDKTSEPSTDKRGEDLTKIIKDSPCWNRCETNITKSINEYATQLANQILSLISPIDTNIDCKALLDQCYRLLNRAYEESYGVKNYGLEKPEFRIVLSAEEIMALRRYAINLPMSERLFVIHGKQHIFGHELQEQRQTPYLEAIIGAVPPDSPIDTERLTVLSEEVACKYIDNLSPDDTFSSWVEGKPWKLAAQAQLAHTIKEIKGE